MTPPASPVRNPTTPASRIPRSQSFQSDTSIEMRQWLPAQSKAGVFTAVEGKEGRAKDLGTTRMGDAETGLATLYAANERNAGTPERTRKSRATWGGSIANRAMEATVFGAALGLTAYRMWTGEGTPPASPTTATHATSLSPTTETGSDTPGPSSLRSAGSDLPPAYSEAGFYNTTTGKQEEEGWEDLDNLDLLRRATGHSRNSSYASRRGVKFRAKVTRHRISRISQRSVASITVEDEDVFAPTFLAKGETAADVPQVEEPEPEPGQEPQEDRRVPLERTPTPADSDEESNHPDEVSRRLDAMSSQIKRLIEQGRKALLEPTPVIYTKDWIDHTAEPGLKGHKRMMSSISSSPGRLVPRKRADTTIKDSPRPL